MTASPINPSDLIPITGAYRHRISLPRVAGYDGVGTVVEAKGAARCLVGTRVLPLRGQGTWQCYVDCEPAWAVPVPETFDDALAARGYINPLAAFLMLSKWNPAGKWVVLTAAGSGCAGLLAQWALLGNAKEVIGIYRTPSHLTSLSEQGVIPVEVGDASSVIERSMSADLVFDCVGGPLAIGILSTMRKDAEFVSYGLLSGQAVKIPVSGRNCSDFTFWTNSKALLT